MEIEVSADFYDSIEKGRNGYAEDNNEEVLPRGEYIECAMNELVIMLDMANEKIAMAKIKEEIEEIIPEVKDHTKTEHDHVMFG